MPSSTIRLLTSVMLQKTRTAAIVTAHLITLAYFFLLRVGEYTRPAKPSQLTVPLRRCDITLWDGDTIIPNHSPIHVLLSATAVSICLENQKNGHMNNSLHHERSEVPFMCAVVSAASLLHYSRHTGPSGPIGSFLDGDTNTQITPITVRETLRAFAIADGLPAKGYDITRIGTHSLRSGGATKLYMQGYSHTTIMTMGRWNSNTYQRYVQPTIQGVTKGMARAMAATLTVPRASIPRAFHLQHTI